MLSRFPLINFYARKNPYEYVQSVRIELAKLILVGTRITYQATADAGTYDILEVYIKYRHQIHRWLLDVDGFSQAE